MFPDGVTMVHRAKIAEFAKAHRLPSMFGWREYCDAGGLASYGASQRATYLRLATYADRILRGEKPADLPVEQPTKFELVINMRTARGLGLTIRLPSSPALMRLLNETAGGYWRLECRSHGVAARAKYQPTGKPIFGILLVFSSESGRTFTDPIRAYLEALRLPASFLLRVDKAVE